MGIMSQHIGDEITSEKLKKIGFEFHLANVVLMRMKDHGAHLADKIDESVELSKKFSFYVWRHPEHKYKYRPLSVRYYPETSVVDGFYNDKYVKFAGCIVAFQHSVSNVCICQKVNDMMDIETALAEVEKYKNKIMRGEV